MSACSWRGRKGEPTWDYARRVFPCFRRAEVTIRERHDPKNRINGNPFKERGVCRTHADEMVASGWYEEVPGDGVARVW